ncbi:ABC transporter permease [Benzoatithermus flavus]|uniref:ABC transporter permease n=1 Tax=Benzoatithermus flavus TaxID=3108223 RepID=A0ABU8XQI3_9PROT
MRLPLFLDIALGHLRRRKRQTVVSILGVALGVGFFVGINALMRGFQQYFITQIIDVAPHIVIRDEFRTPSPQPAFLAFPRAAVTVSGVKPKDEPRGIRNARAKLAELEALPGVAAAPTLQGQVILRYGTRDVPVSLYGIEPERERRVTNIERDLAAGRLEDLRSTANALIVGVGVAEKLGGALGDTISVVSPRGVTLSMKIVGLIRTGISSIDNGQAYALLKTVQVLQNRSNVVNQIRIRLDDVAQAEPLARRIEARMRYRTESWEETNRNVLSLFVIQNSIMYSVVGAILLVAAFGIYNIISTVVYEKTRDIAILKSLGFGERDIQAIFLAEGVIVGLLGGLVGALVGQGLIELLAQVRFANSGPVIGGRNGFILARETWPYVAGAAFALLASVMAALIPARRAARLNPVDIIRGAA